MARTMEAGKMVIQEKNFGKKCHEMLQERLENKVLTVCCFVQLYTVVHVYSILMHRGDYFYFMISAFYKKYFIQCCDNLGEHLLILTWETNVAAGVFFSCFEYHGYYY